MPSDLDIYRAANQMIDLFGDDAPLQAARRSDMFLEQGDVDGQAKWKLIKAAIEELLNETPTGSVH